MTQGNLIFLAGIVLSLALITRGLPPFRGTGVPFSLFCLGMVLFAAFFLWLGKSQARLVRLTELWLPAKAIVVQAEVVPPESGEPPRFVFEYVFEVDGDTYNGNTLRFGQTEVAAEDGQALVERFPQGAEIEIHHDPRNPNRSVVIKETSRGVRMAYVVGGCLAMVPLFLVLRRTFRKRKLATGKRSDGK